MTVALYSTIWISLALFVATQHGYRSSRFPDPRSMFPRPPARRLPQGSAIGPAPRPPGWVHAANATGLALCVIHIALAMGSVHGWRHAAAIEATAIQTESVYGLRWGGGVFVNYLFVIVWALEAWGRTRTRAFSESRFARWLLRTFYAVVVVNAAVVFARGSMRMTGFVLVVALVLAWRPRSRSKQRDAPAL